MALSTDRKIRRFLFIGPTGVGKSTLINILFNNDVKKTSMSKPAITSEGSAGSTTCFTTYYNFPNYAFTDTIGFGDNRFDEQHIFSMLKAIIKNSMVGYNQIYVCISYGRISSDIRYYIDLLITIFGQRILKWCTIIFTHCNVQQMTKEKYIEANRDDTEIIKIINSVQNVIFGDNMTDHEVDHVFIARRQRLLDSLKENIEKSNTGYFTPQPENFREWITAIYNMIISKYAKQIKTNLDVIHQISLSIVNLKMHKNFANYYGECPICLEDMWNTDSVFTKCYHIFHERCINQWLNDGKNNCPNCPATIDRRNSFLTSLLFDWDCIEESEVT
ncbi:unnamed protein product [Adineta steineri]|uniref:RING-type domain-containing protein n=1 Tax=Adineta steineri TaxID=433720 RepID=A0A818UVS9_9BILA|nr:unnamed protein product [Adineta steineri]CAF1157541.1 unnamed protein product [Adineta steineri]CAF3626400.1 unnamed protein product [Adineta steineri]CAF3706145.1 unnamed protein product [Adineta steineri]CAF3729833.1 unnamed protein product [Adineta steineri]